MAGLRLGTFDGAPGARSILYADVLSEALMRRFGGWVFFETLSPEV